MPSPGRLLFRAFLVAIMAGLLLGILPPIVAGGTPPTVIRTVPVDLPEVVPGPSRAAGAGGPAVQVDRPTWTDPVSRCAPIRFTMVGVTWRQAGDEPVEVELAWGPEGELGPARTIIADPDEGPDPGSPDDAGIDGTAPQWTGEADCLRVRLRLPPEERFEDLKLVFLNSSGTAADPSPLAALGSAMARLWGMTDASPAAAMTKKPAIVTRKGWGADENLRKNSCSGEPSYAAKLKMAHVHHTAGSNSYAASESDDIVRGIYSYHVTSRGFCDIGYNFLIDKYGQIFEGRYGGMARPVIGAHAMGFNTGSTGVAAMGDFTTKKPPWKMIRSYKRLLAWRLDVAHVKPRSRVTMTSAGGSNTPYAAGEEVKLKRISGHRDTGYTSCPGDKLYDKLRVIRKGAELIGRPKIWNPRQRPRTLEYGENKVRYTAKLSATLNWTIAIENEAGKVVRTLSGRGSKIDRRWAGKASGVPVPPGEYKVIMGAESDKGKVARTKKFKLTVTGSLLP